MARWRLLRRYVNGRFFLGMSECVSARSPDASQGADEAAAADHLLLGLDRRQRQHKEEQSAAGEEPGPADGLGHVDWRAETGTSYKK